jgi:hypothetical protein
MKKPIEKATLAKLKKLSAMAEGLQNGEDYPITRLTTLKSLCVDLKCAARFALHLTKLTATESARCARPRHLNVAVWRDHKALIARSLEQLESYIQKPTPTKKKLLYDLLAEAKDINDEYKPSRWGAIRIIQNRQVLIIEDSLQCVLSSTAEEAGYWAYHAARDYAERYDPHYGTGLIPESAPLVKAIVRFWCEYYGVEI